MASNQRALTLLIVGIGKYLTDLRQETSLQAGKGTSGLAKTSSFFTPIRAHSMFDSSIIIGLTASTGKRLLQKETERLQSLN